jgi:hypothetical protein
LISSEIEGISLCHNKRTHPQWVVQSAGDHNS